MTLWIGRRASIGVASEALRGVGAAPTYWINPLSFSFADVPERAISDASFGGIWGGDQSLKVLEKAEGDIEMEVDDRSFGVFLRSVFGAVSPATIDTSAYKHTYTISNTNQHTSMTLTVDDPIGQLQFELSMIDTLEMSFVANQIVKSKVKFISKGSQDTSLNTPSFSTATKKFVGRHLQFKVADVTANLAAASAVSLLSLNLRFEKNAEAQSTLSTVQPEDVVNKKFAITGDFTLNYEDRTWLNYVKNGTYRAIRINLIHDDLAGAATQKYEFLLDLSKCAIESFDPDFSMDDVVKQKFNFTALYDAGGNNNVVNNCYLVNKVTTYA